MKIRKSIAVIIAIAMTVALIPAAVSAASGKVSLPSKVTEYKKDGGKWVKKTVYEYTYDKAGRTTKEVEKSYQNGKLYMTEITKHVYKTQGDTVVDRVYDMYKESEPCDENTLTMTIYEDKKGFIKKIVDVEKTIKFSYKNGRVVKAGKKTTYKYKPNMKEPTSVTTYVGGKQEGVETFDKNGITLTYKNEDGTQKFKNKYNSNKQLISTTWKNQTVLLSGDVVSVEYKQTYQYTKARKWTRDYYQRFMNDDPSVVSDTEIE